MPTARAVEDGPRRRACTGGSRLEVVLAQADVGRAQKVANASDSVEFASTQSSADSWSVESGSARRWGRGGQRPCFQHGWWDRVRGHSLGWVSAHGDDGLLIGFVNVAWDGADHAFLLDTKVRPEHQHRGIGTELVHHASDAARGAGCEWLHVDFRPELGAFYFDACGFTRTDAGLQHLRDVAP
ncbi:GNAT family N-acetyltransferase [Nocardia sp. NPDC051990]|uniref:GNAT family N-acetyltransferase n=1 Tax=Nocardia sp. NPDC051990 TaxID=3155285 RepID=UPI0034427821